MNAVAFAYPDLGLKVAMFDMQLTALDQIRVKPLFQVWHISYTVCASSVLNSSCNCLMKINKPDLIQSGTSVSLQELSSLVLYILIEKLVNNPVTVGQWHKKTIFGQKVNTRMQMLMSYMPIGGNIYDNLANWFYIYHFHFPTFITFHKDARK